MIEYIAYFIIFGLLGWIVDTWYRYATKGNHANTFFPFFGMIYAIGGVALLAFYQHAPVSQTTHVFVGGVAITSLEFFGGIFCKKYLGHRFWNYSKEPFNLKGHIDLRHTIFWFMLAAVLRIVAPYLPR